MSTSKKNGRDVEMGPLLSGVSAESKSSSHTTLINRTGPHGTLDEYASEKGTQTPIIPPFSKMASALSMYSFCSVGMVLVNKSLSSSYNHYFENDINVLVVVFQAITAVLCVELSKKAGFVEYPPFDMKIAKQWAPVNIIFCLMLFTGMASLKHNSVPMVTIFKNITNIFTAFGDKYFFGTHVEAFTMVAFFVMLAGAVAAAWNDISITFTGLFWMSANCVSSASYVLALKFATKEVKLSKFGMVFYNNVLCVFFLLPAASAMGEVYTLLATEEVHTSDYFMKNLFAGFVGFFLNFASLNCVSVAGPITYAIVGSLNKIPTTILGWMIYDANITSDTWFFIIISMCGGFIYSYAKINEQKKKASEST